MLDKKKHDLPNIDYKWWAAASAKMQKFVAILVGPVFVFGLLGFYLDKKIQTDSVFLTLFILLGFVLSIFMLYKITKHK